MPHATDAPALPARTRPRRLRPALLLACVAAAWAASQACSVTIEPFPEGLEAREAARALGSAYLLIGKPPAAPLSRLAAERPFDVDASAFADELNAQLSRRGAGILAYRVVDDVSREEYARRLNPSSLLVVRFETLTLSRERREKSVKVKDKESGADKTVKVPVFVFRARLGLRARLALNPERRTLTDSPLQVGLQEEVVSESGRDITEAEWAAGIGQKLARRAAQMLPELFPPVPAVQRKRTLYVDKKAPLSVEAAKKASQGLWEEASALWAERVEAVGGWKDPMNLALAAERRRLYAEAGRIYRSAQAAARGDKEAAKIPWTEIYADLAAGEESLGGSSEQALRWFSAPFSVLPFSDETTSVDGPERLRALAQEALRRGGYNVLPLEAVDIVLRSRGYSQGGQLKRVKSEDIAEWLGSQRLLFGDITEFRDIMLGVYGQRTVAGELRIWDSETEAALWASALPAVTSSGLTVNGTEAVARLGGQLLRGLFERTAGTPLGPESALFVRQNLERFPLRPREP